MATYLLLLGKGIQIMQVAKKNLQNVLKNSPVCNGIALIL